MLCLNCIFPPPFILPFNLASIHSSITNIHYPFFKFRLLLLFFPIINFLFPPFLFIPPFHPLFCPPPHAGPLTTADGRRRCFLTFDMEYFLPPAVHDDTHTACRWSGGGVKDTQTHTSCVICREVKSFI